MILSNYFKRFFNSSQSSGITLLFCVFLSLIIANSSFGNSFKQVLEQNVGTTFLSLQYPVITWINDGLVSIFFLLVGLEIKREIIDGELSDIRKALPPVFAALGGMLVPALIYIGFNYKTPYINGWGIPMATDIAFSLAIISMLGSKVPSFIKVFLAALAIVDDLGAIIVIAIFYTDSLHWMYLLLSFGVVIILFLLNYIKVKHLSIYLFLGLFLWYFMHHSGIHATISGVLLAFSIPTHSNDEDPSPLEKLENALNIPVQYIIMPLFALVNTNIVISSAVFQGLFNSMGYGIFFGLVIGKMLGINLFSYLTVRLKWSSLPPNISIKHMIGTGFFGGIGFTMSIFISLLSFKGYEEVQSEAKIAILIASFVSGITGYLILHSTKKKKSKIKSI